MTNHDLPEESGPPLSLVQATRAFGNGGRLRENFLLFSGIGLVVVAATMVITTMLG